jgi:hypothetical protein
MKILSLAAVALAFAASALAQEFTKPPKKIEDPGKAEKEKLEMKQALTDQKVGRIVENKGKAVEKEAAHEAETAAILRARAKKVRELGHKKEADKLDADADMFEKNSKKNEAHGEEMVKDAQNKINMGKTREHELKVKDAEKKKP